MADLIISVTFADTTGCCGGTACFLTMPTQLVDSTTTPYATSTDASNAIADQAGGCLVEGRSQGSDTRTAFSATFVSGTLAITSNYSFASFGGDVLAFRVHLTASGGISIVYSATATGGFGNFLGLTVYADDQSTVVDSTSPSTPASGTWVPTIPSNGYYFVKAIVGGLGTTATTLSLSCTGTSMTPCSIRAAYGSTPDYVVCV